MIDKDDHLQQREIARLAELHLQTLEGSILSLLGKKSLEQYYSFCARSSHEWVFYSRDGETIVGGCVLSFSPESVTTRALKSAPIFYAFTTLWRCIFSPAVLRKVLDFLKKPATECRSLEGLPEVIQIFADPDYQNKGVGTQLLTQVEQCLRERGVFSYFMKTIALTDNRALVFYKRKNFEKVFEDRTGAKPYVYFRKDLQRNLIVENGSQRASLN